MDCKALKQRRLKSEWGLPFAERQPFFIFCIFFLPLQITHIPISIYIANSSAIALLNYTLSQRRLVMC